MSGLAFREYKFTGAFGRLVGFWAACVQGSYLGIEIIGIVAEETERPRATIPHSVRRVAYRGLIYHAGAVFVLGLNVSANDPILKIIATQEYASPFALMVQRAGIPILAHIINGVSVVALLGVANTRLYVSVITLLYSLHLFRVGPYRHLQMKVRLPGSSRNKPKDGRSRSTVLAFRHSQHY